MSWRFRGVQIEKRSFPLVDLISRLEQKVELLEILNGQAESKDWFICAALVSTVSNLLSHAQTLA